MSGMHLVRGMTSNNQKKRKGKTNKKLAQAQAEHEKWLAKMGVKGTSTDVRSSIPNYKEHQATVALGNKVADSAPQRQRNVYSGERVLLGVATMHKSNMVPVFADKKEDAKDIANMRRN